LSTQLENTRTGVKGRVIIDTSYPGHNLYLFEDHSNWMGFYPDAGEDIPKDLSPEKGPRVRMTIYIDANHAHDLVTRRSITGILVVLNNTPIRWISKRQMTEVDSRKFFFCSIFLEITFLTSLRFIQYHGSRFYATYHASS
jgi:hypothetical protein